MTRDDSAPKIVRAATERFGRLDILLNNAGINMSLFRRPDGKPSGKFWEVTPEEFRRIIEVNVVAAFLMTRAALPAMLKQRWGRIINVTTSLDTMYRAGMQPYGGSKAANEAHLLALAQELEGTGVTANVLVPGGAANTRMVSLAQAAGSLEAGRARSDGGAAALALLERVRRRQRPALHRHALGQEPAAGGGGEKSRRARCLAAARPPGDHARAACAEFICYQSRVLVLARRHDGKRHGSLDKIRRGLAYALGPYRRAAVDAADIGDELDERRWRVRGAERGRRGKRHRRGARWPSIGPKETPRSPARQQGLGHR